MLKAVNDVIDGKYVTGYFLVKTRVYIKIYIRYKHSRQWHWRLHVDVKIDIFLYLATE